MKINIKYSDVCYLLALLENNRVEIVHEQSDMTEKTLFGTVKQYDQARFDFLNDRMDQTDRLCRRFRSVCREYESHKNV